MFGFSSCFVASQDLIRWDSVVSIVLGMVSGMYCFEIVGGGGCDQLRKFDGIGKFGEAHLHQEV